MPLERMGRSVILLGLVLGLFLAASSLSFQSPTNRRRVLLGGATTAIFLPTVSTAAPPFAIIAEELGYFPVQDSKGNTVFVSKRIQRESTAQAVQLAQKLRDKGVVLAGTYWCPHTLRQKELLGKQAFMATQYVECSPKGYKGNPGYCMSHNVDGYPAWIFRNGQILSGEHALGDLARKVGMSSFQDDLETNLPPLIGAGACAVGK